MAITVNAHPRKHFFIEMFTRDIALEDCVLDLIDNSIDGMLRVHKIDIEHQVLAMGTGQQPTKKPKGNIRVDYSPKQFKISDNSGGISYDHAVADVFCFGHAPGVPKGRLGVYGIGLKRAIFKIGNKIEVESHTSIGGFKVDIDVSKWALADDDLSDWTFPVTKLPKTNRPPGTVITITQLHREVITRISDGTLDSSLRKTIAQTYPFFIDQLVELKINGIHVERRDLPFGGSGDLEPGISRFESEGVRVVLLVTVAPKDKRIQDLAGWYVLCNGRVVVNADKSELTGWGSGLPAFHSKYRGFVGLALFYSEDPSHLPWTTSKRGLNREAVVFQIARNKMTSVAKPVISFLNDMYPSDMAEHPQERALAERVVAQDFRSALQRPSSAFKTSPIKATKKTARVQFDAAVRDLERIRKVLKRPSMAASDVGRLTFDHYLKTECPE